MRKVSQLSQRMVSDKTQIHARMLDAVLRAKMIFFSKTRAGSIVQRFGDDLVSAL